MGGFWLGLGSGLAARQHEDKLQQIQQASALAKQLHEDFLKMAQDPEYRTEAQEEASTRALQALQVDVGKPNAMKELQKMAQFPMTVMSKRSISPGKPAIPGGSVKVPSPQLETPSGEMVPSGGPESRITIAPRGEQPPEWAEGEEREVPSKWTQQEKSLMRLRDMTQEGALKTQMAIEQERAMLPIEIEKAEALAKLKPPEFDTVTTPRGAITTPFNKRTGELGKTIEGREYVPTPSKLQDKVLADESGQPYKALFDPDPKAQYHYYRVGEDGGLEPIIDPKPYQAPTMGMAIPLQTETGEMTGAWFPRTGKVVQAPEGARRTPLPSEELDKRVTGANLIEDVNTVEQLALKHKDVIGPWMGPIVSYGIRNIPESVRNILPTTVKKALSDPEVIQMFSLLDNARNRLFYVLSGKQTNEQEIKRITRLVPMYDVPFESFMGRLRMYRSNLQRELEKKQTSIHPSTESASKPPIAPSTTSTKVKLRAPDGSVREVPADQADHYISLGAVRVK